MIPHHTDNYPLDTVLASYMLLVQNLILRHPVSEQVQVYSPACGGFKKLCIVYYRLKLRYNVPVIYTILWFPSLALGSPHVNWNFRTRGRAQYKANDFQCHSCWVRFWLKISVHNIIISLMVCWLKSLDVVIPATWIIRLLCSIFQYYCPSSVFHVCTMSLLHRNVSMKSMALCFPATNITNMINSPSW